MKFNIIFDEIQLNINEILFHILKIQFHVNEV